MNYDEILEELERLQKLQKNITDLVEDLKERCPICNFPLERNGNCRQCGYCERC